MALAPAQGITKGTGVTPCQGIVPIEHIVLDELAPEITTAITGKGVVSGEVPD